MDEVKELKVKNALMWFLRQNFEFEGTPEAVLDKSKDIVTDLYELFLMFDSKK